MQIQMAFPCEDQQLYLQDFRTEIRAARWNIGVQGRERKAAQEMVVEV